VRQWLRALWLRPIGKESTLTTFLLVLKELRERKSQLLTSFVAIALAR